MKDFISRVAFLGLLLLLIPLVFTTFFSKEESEKTSTEMIAVYDNKNDIVSDMELEEYIVNVVAAEMPASFSEEALKAQAVCARTYALRKVNSGLAEHKGGDVCTDFNHCQAYYDEDTMKEKWGKDYRSNLEKIRKCVFETTGEVITYNGEYAISVFHSCSNGKTENAKDVWGGDYPYLVSVDSIGDFEKKDYSSKVTYTKDEFLQKINFNSDNEISDAQISVSVSEMTEGNNVATVTVGNVPFKGTDIRKFLSLKSTSFTVEEKNNEVTFTVYGNGHGVGMSQYGANAMAEKGEKYDAILKHYYKGTVLENMNNIS